MTNPTSRPIAAVWPSRAAAWSACAILFLAYVLSFVDRGILGILAARVEADFHIGDVQFSLLQGFSFAVFYAAFGLPVAWLIDTGRRGLVVAGGILAWSLATALCGLCHSFAQIFVCRIVVGAGEATLLPGATSILKDSFPPQRRGIPLGVFAAGLFIGSAGAGLGTAAILRSIGSATPVLPLLGPLQPWRVVMLSVGLVGLPVALLAATIRIPRREAAASATLFDLSPLLSLYRARGRALWLHHLGFTAACFASYAIAAWMPLVFVRQFGWGLPKIGLVLGLLTLITGPLGSLAGGLLADLLARRGARDGKMLVGIVSALGMMVPALLFGLARTETLSLTLLAIYSFFASFIWGLAPGSLQEIVPGPVLGRVTAFYTAVVNLVAMSLGPLATALAARLFAPGPQALGHAISVVVPLACVAAAGGFAACRAPYRAIRDAPPD